jgi:hypothetical protein
MQPAKDPDQRSMYHKYHSLADKSRRCHAVGGESDIAQYLQVLPGVISTGDQGGQIYIRGGSPIQNKILMDGLDISSIHFIRWDFTQF